MAKEKSHKKFVSNVDENSSATHKVSSRAVECCSTTQMIASSVMKLLNGRILVWTRVQQNQAVPHIGGKLITLKHYVLS